MGANPETLSLGWPVGRENQALRSCLDQPGMARETDGRPKTKKKGYYLISESFSDACSLPMRSRIKFVWSV